MELGTMKERYDLDLTSYISDFYRGKHQEALFILDACQHLVYGYPFFHHQGILSFREVHLIEWHDIHEFSPVLIGERYENVPHQ
jgi:hypothetical protein